MFASNYLKKKKNNRQALLSSAPPESPGIIVVIPAYRELEIINTLNSLNACYLPESRTEVIVVINHPENEKEEIKDINHTTKRQLDKWINARPSGGISFYVIGPVDLPQKWAGAGLARKTGMDEAVMRFNTFSNEKGIVVSLDADTLVEKNYLQSIEQHFRENSENVGVTIAFEHRTDGLSEKHRQGILLYEKYLRYYKNAVAFTGYPYAMFTIGSAFAVTAEAYVKRGGMNRRKAGEDFYFLQNLAHIGQVGEINSTKVWPSARLSDRVPFGTGPALIKWLNGTENLNKTFHFDSFVALKSLFKLKELFFQSDEKNYTALLEKLPKPVKHFLVADNFLEQLADLNCNCATPSTFQSRFFQKFNAFKILKYLNFVHQKYFQKGDLADQVLLLEKESSRKS